MDVDSGLQGFDCRPRAGDLRADVGTSVAEMKMVAPNEVRCHLSLGRNLSIVMAAYSGRLARYHLPRFVAN
jgi:hypothetical protein